MDDLTDKEIDDLFKEMVIDELLEFYDERLELLSLQPQNNVAEIAEVNTKVDALLLLKNSTYGTK